MKRTVLIGLLAAGTVFGFVSGCASLVCHAHRHHAVHERFEDRVADVCLRAAAQRESDPVERGGVSNRGVAQALEAAERAASAAERAALAAERCAIRPTGAGAASEPSH